MPPPAEGGGFVPEPDPVAERSARERAERALQERDQFLARVSHELRSPLNGIQSWTHVLEAQLKDSTAPLVARALGGIRNGIEQQVRLIDEALDAARMMSGRLVLDPKPVKLEGPLRAAVEAARNAAQARGVAVDAPLDAADGLVVSGEPARLQQLFAGLLSHACQLTPAKQTVRAQLVAEDDGVAWIVTHEGPRLDEAAADLLFAWQGSRGHRAGLGLELPIAHHLARLHGGSLTATEGGTRLELRLPLSAQS